MVPLSSAEASAPCRGSSRARRSGKAVPFGVMSDSESLEGDVSGGARLVEELRVSGEWDEPEVRTRCLELLEREGACVLTQVVDKRVLEEVREAVEPTLQRIAERLEEDGQNLSEEVKNEFGLVRAPPVGDGKTNVHFDEYESPEHGAMERLARQSRFEDIVSSYIGRPCTLYEAGASITTPGGEGMEWHRDGTEGEVTVLMSLSNVEADQGQLGVIPRSHKGAKLEKLKDEELTAADDDKAVWYSYRAGCPMIIDARTQHSVRDNVSQDTRCILWYIYN